jgi:hypothetical protein
VELLIIPSAQRSYDGEAEMTTSTIDDSQRKAAKVAGLSSLLTMAIVVIGNFGIRERLIVAGNVAETARNILAHERLFRINIALDLLYVAGVIVLLSALYLVLKPVSRGIALVGAFFRLVYTLMWVVLGLNSFLTLRLLSGADYLQVFEAERLQALARFYLASGVDVYYVGLVFYALASTVCAYLWFRSKYIPAALAVFGVIASAFCAACTFAFIISPNFKQIVNLWWFDSPMAVFEMATGFWLLFKGLRPSAKVP